MKKKNLVILLIVPFIIAALTIITVNMSYNLIDVDISHIQWEYNDVEAFKMTEGQYVLTAIGVNQRNHQVSDGNDLVWSVANKNNDVQEPCAEIIYASGTYFLKPLQQGEVIVTCANNKGTVSRSFTAIVYVNGVVYLMPTLGQTKYDKVDSTNYFGQYDFKDGRKVNASFDVQMVAMPSSLLETVSVNATGNANLDINLDSAQIEGERAVVNGKASVDGIGNVSFALTSDVEQDGIVVRGYDFTVIENGVNVYTYDDLLDCTNRSRNGEIAVLQRSFVAANSQYDSNEVCFGRQKADGSVDLRGDVEYIETTYNHNFIDQWNATISSDKHIDTTVCVGLHVKADMYGNGNMINFHNLAFPSQTINGVPSVASSDLFKGPLTFYTVGDPNGAIGSDMNNMNLISAYGQDNIGMYIDGDNIMLNDVIVQNCDDVQSLSFLNTVGTVVEVNGNNVELRNCRLANGRQVLRSFSNFGLKVNNCRLSTARNFLFLTGSNEYSPVNENAMKNFLNENGALSKTLKAFLSPGESGDKLMMDYLDGTFGTDKGLYSSKAALKNALLALQDALTDKRIEGQFVGDTQIVDCVFYRSGITSIALESLFNGPFLFSSEVPTNIAPFFALVNETLLGQSFTPSRVSGTSYPVKVNISGKTKFYDYKTYDELDLTGLIRESISMLAREYLGKDNYTIDNIFPLKRLLQNNPFECVSGDTVKVNMPIAYFGGGANYSIVTTDGMDAECMRYLNGASQDKIVDATPVDLLDAYLSLPPLSPMNVGNLGSLGSMMSGLKVDQNTLIKTVTLVTGYEPFKFVFIRNGYLAGEVPSIADMQQNASNMGGTL